MGIFSHKEKKTLFKLLFAGTYHFVYVLPGLMFWLITPFIQKSAGVVIPTLCTLTSIAALFVYWRMIKDLFNTFCKLVIMSQPVVLISSIVAMFNMTAASEINIVYFVVAVFVTIRAVAMFSDLTEVMLIELDSEKHEPEIEDIE